MERNERFHMLRRKGKKHGRGQSRERGKKRKNGTELQEESINKKELINRENAVKILPQPTDNIAIRVVVL